LGDGSDDTAAFQRAIAALAGNGLVIIPPAPTSNGFYRITNPLTVAPRKVPAR
jgi:hypothetical protein